MADAPSRLVAALADRYRLERELGQGGMATVYLAQDLKHDRKVALKVLKPELAAVLGAERFVVEIKTTAALQHPHILPLFDSGEANGFLYYVMPFIDGETLRAKLDRETQLGVDEAVKITTDVAGALHYAHTHGVIHRDIKPENILLHDGRPMVADFGIALAVSAAAGGRMTETGLSLGTPHYMSPEQATAEKEITARSDQYSLASVLYEMLAGEPPHGGGSAQQIIMKIITERAAPVTTWRKSVPLNIAAALSRGLEKLPADRFASIAAFAEALANPAFRVAGMEAATATAAGARGVSRPVFAATVLSLGALAVWGWVHRPADTDSTAPVAFSVDQTGPFGIVMPTIDEVLPLALSPDGRMIAYVVRPNGIPMLAVRALDQPTASVLVGTENVQGGITFSPDGRALAFVQQGRLRRIALDGTPPVDLADLGVVYQALSIVWLPDGNIYFVGSGTGRSLYRVEASGVSAAVAIPYPDSLGALLGLKPIPNTPWMLTSGTRGTRPVTVAVSIETGEGRIIDVEASGAMTTADGRAILLVKENGTVTIAPFDPATLAITGPEVPVLRDIGGSQLGKQSALTLTPSGTLAYLRAERRENQLVEVSRSGTERPLSGKPDSYKDPRWSPDGTRLAFTISDAGVTGDVFVEDLRAGTRTRLMTGSQNWYPLWTPDSRALVLASLRESTLGIWRVPVDGAGEAVRVSTGGTLPQLITPDGQTLLYRVESRATGTDVYATPLDVSGSTRAILNTPASELAPDLSRDQRWLVYASDESGRSEVYVTAWPGLGARRQLSSGGGEEPRWNPRGGELFYRNGDALVAVTLEERDGMPSAVQRDTLFRGSYSRQPRWPQYDVSADGQRFLMVRESERKEPVVVITNWLPSALERMRTGAVTP